jgi:hypothetical protein
MCLRATYSEVTFIRPLVYLTYENMASVCLSEYVYTSIS